jgi:hypothetical protein
MDALFVTNTAAVNELKADRPSLTTNKIRRYRSIPAATVGWAMVAAARQEKNGTQVCEYDQIVSLAESLR